MVGLALLVGIAGGCIITAVTGARRTATAVDRFVAYSRPTDVAVQGAVDEQDLRRLPEVFVTYRELLFLMAPPSRSLGGPDLSLVDNVYAWVMGANGETWTTVDKSLLVAGRRPRLDDPHEIAVSHFTARRFGLRPGSRLTLYAYAPDQLAQVDTPGPSPPLPTGPAITFTVAGIERHLYDIFELTPQDIFQYFQVYLTPAFYPEYRDRVANVNHGWTKVGLRRGGGDVPAFKEALPGMPGGDDAFLFVGNDRYEVAVAAQGAVRAGEVGLFAFGALAAVVATLIIGQTLAQEVRTGAADPRTLKSLGMTRRQMMAVALVRTGAVAVMAAVVAAAVAVATSPLTPVGVARWAEIDPGVAVDWAVLAPGLALIVVLVSACCLFAPGQRRRGILSQVRLRRRGLPRVAERLARAGLPPAGVTGVRMALARPTRRRPSMRAAVTGTAATVAAIAIVLILARSVEHLVTTPRLQGWNWDVMIGDPRRPDAEMRALIDADPAVAEYSQQTSAGAMVTLAGRELRAIVIDPMRGSVFPTVRQGRPPAEAGEVALASTTLRRSGRTIGDEVMLEGVNGSATYRVVGEIIYPAALDDFHRLDDGVAMTAGGMDRISAQGSRSWFLLRFTPEADRPATLARLRQLHGSAVVLPFLTFSVQGLDELRPLPQALTAFLVVIGIGTLIHGMITSVRRRRRDFAVLKTVGFTRPQVSATIAWQATTVVACALAVGLPVGIVAGRWAWRLLGGSVGATFPAVVPVLSLLLVVVGVIVVGNVVAALPARAAARVRPANVLRAE